MRNIQCILSISKRLIHFAALSIMFFSACDSEPYISTEGQGTPIAFTQTQITTKGAVVTELMSIGVIGYFLQLDAVGNPYVNTPNFMYNQLMISNSGSLTYSPIKYWPAGEKDRLQFFAYAPYSQNITNRPIVLSGPEVTGYPTLTYTPSTNVSEQIDLMVAGTGALQQKDGVVKLNFKHVLTQITFSVSYTATDPTNVNTVTINSLTIKGAMKSRTGKYANENFSWGEEVADTSHFQLALGSPIPLMANKETPINNNDPFLLLPQVLTENVTAEITLSINDTLIEEPITASLHTSQIQAWGEGKRINYHLNMDISKLIPTIETPPTKPSDPTQPETEESGTIETSDPTSSDTEEAVSQI